MAYQKLHQLILDGNWEQLNATFAAMTHTEFRRASMYLRTSVLPVLENNVCWEAIFHLVQYRRQAFLSCVLALQPLALSGRLDFSCQGAQAFAVYLLQEAPEAVPKVVNMVLPFLQTDGQVDVFFHTFRVEDKKQQVLALLKVESPLAYYLLFTRLRHLPDCRQFALDCCRYIMRRDNDMAYNMVAIMQAYFGLYELRGQFSLRIAPYELSLLDRDAQSFYHVLNGKRPQL